MSTRLAWLVGLVVGLCGAEQALAVRPDKSRLHVMTVPGLPDVSCAGPGSGKTPKCTAIAFGIVALQIPNPAGGAPLCLAYFTYNKLTAYVGRGNAGAELSWQLPPDAQFIGNGIVFTTPPGVPLSKFVHSQGVGTVKIKSRALLNIPFGHLPDIELKINGVWTPCGGVDPGIVVTAD